MNREEAYAILNLVGHIGPISVRRLIDQFGDAEAVLKASESDLRKVEGIGLKSARAISRWEEEVPWQAELEQVSKQGLRLICQESEDYPVHLKEIHDPPLVLYVKGQMNHRQKNSIAMVGMRHPTHYGQEVARGFGYQLGTIGMSVVSGLAMGIDACAHRGCLQAKGHTLAVLGFGFDYLSKSGNSKLAQEIVDSGGAVVTEFPMARSPDKQTFPMRNRIVSGMTLGTLVVEAAVQSGALITANFALEQGRQVFAVPGSIDRAQSQGCNRLIQGGAKLVQSIDDLLVEFEYLIPQSAEEKAAVGETKGAGRALEIKLTETEKAVYQMVTDGEVEIDQILDGCELPSPVVSSTLMILEMKRLVRQLPGKRYVRTKGVES